jgi:hypothetical protein
MTDRAKRWCPHCRKITINAPLPQMSGDEQHLLPGRTFGEPEAFRRKLYCVECRDIWRSLELPEEHVFALWSAQEELEDCRRQIALLRLFLARQTEQQLEQPTQALQPLRRAG